MTKAELVEEVARAAELNKRDAEVIVETVFDSIIGALHKGEKVELRGFGSFRTRERGPRRGRNPKTGEPVDVPAKRVPYFKPGKELKEYFTEEPEGGSEVDDNHVEPISAPTGEPLGEPQRISSDASEGTGATGSADKDENVSPGASGAINASENRFDTSIPPAEPPPSQAEPSPAQNDSTRVPNDEDY